MKARSIREIPTRAHALTPSRRSRATRSGSTARCRTSRCRARGATTRCRAGRGDVHARAGRPACTPTRATRPSTSSRASCSSTSTATSTGARPARRSRSAAACRTRSSSRRPTARFLVLNTPGGQDRFFRAGGEPAASRDLDAAPPPNHERTWPPRAGSRRRLRWGRRRSQQVPCARPAADVPRSAPEVAGRRGGMIPLDDR